MTSAIRGALGEWLETERESFVASARSLGLPLSVQVEQPVGERSGNATMYSQRIDSVSAANHRIMRAYIFERMGVCGPDLANAIVDEFGSTCALEEHSAAFNRAPAGWVQTNLLLPLRLEHLRELNDPSVPNEQVRDRLADDLIAYLSSPNITRVTCLPVSGLVPASGCEYGDVRLRLLTPEEIGRVHGVTVDATELGDRRAGVWPFHVGGHPTAALELRETFLKARPAPSRRLFAKLILALQLRGFDPNCGAMFGSGSVWAYSWNEPGGYVWATSYPMRLASQGDERTVGVDDLTSALSLAKEIPDGAVERPHSSMDVGLHRFGLGASRDSKEDGLIDYVVTLESVLLSGGNQELSFRFRLFGGKYLAVDGESTRAMYKELKELYELRSTLIHGSKFPSAADVAVALPRARHIAARALLKCLEHGWPSQRDFEDVALGAHESDAV